MKNLLEYPFFSSSKRGKKFYNLNVRLSWFAMGERHFLCSFMYSFLLFVLIEFGLGLETEPLLDELSKIVSEQQCASILATELSAYQGKLSHLLRSYTV